MNPLPQPHPLPIARSLPAAMLAVSLPLFLLGCSEPEPSALPLAQTAESPSSTASAGGLDREIWEIHRIGGQRVGYGRTSVQTRTVDGRPTLRIEGDSQMDFTRAGQQVSLGVSFASLESPDGGLIEFETVLSQAGNTIQRTTGKVTGPSLLVEVEIQGKKSSERLSWSRDFGGLYATELSLLRAPLKPGQRRTIRSLIPGLNQLGTSDLVARDFEEVELLGGSRRLLRIDAVTTTADGQQLRAVLWTDESGDILRRFEEAMQMESLRADKDQALAKTDQARFDLVLGLSVPVDRRIEKPFETSEIHYRLVLDGRNPAEVFTPTAYQQITPAGDGAAEVTVFGASAGAKPPASPADPPTALERQPNNVIQSDDPKIQAIARSIEPDESDPWRIAAALEREASRRIRNVNYSQAFATAAEVIESGTGDCTEHAVLLAALARARGVPARVVIGLVYVEEAGQPAFGYHMWNELYLGDLWVPFDATRPRGGASAAYLRLGSSSLQGVSALSSFLPVAQVAGRLKITIEEVK